MKEVENKWAAILTFGLEVKGDTCPALEMKGILQGDVDRCSGNEGVLEIMVSRVPLNKASLTRQFVECRPADGVKMWTLTPNTNQPVARRGVIIIVLIEWCSSSNLTNRKIWCQSVPTYNQGLERRQT